MKMKSIKVLATYLLFINIFTINVFAKSAGGIMDGGTVDAPNNNGSGSYSGSSPGSSKPNGGGGSTSSSKPGSAYNNPKKLYYYSQYDWDMKVAFDNFCGWGTNGSSMTYKDRRGTGSRWLNPYDDKWYEDYFPAAKFEKWHNTKTQEESRVTDYYTWKCVGPESWEVREGRYKSVVFHKTGKYTVTSIPHQVVTTSTQLFYTSKAYDVFSDGHSKTIHSASGSNPKEYTTTYVNRNDLMRKWVFEITPDEVDKPIPLPPPPGVTPPGGPTEVNPDSIEWDVELIH